MRYLVCGVFAGLLLASPAFAQASSSNSSAAPKPAAQSPQNGASPSQPAAGDKPADPAPARPKDDSMTNYDVNGSNASDAMGASR